MGWEATDQLFRLLSLFHLHHGSQSFASFLSHLSNFLARLALFLEAQSENAILPFWQLFY